MRLRLEKLSRKNKTQIIKISLLCFGKAYTNKEVNKWLEIRLGKRYESIDDVLEYFLVFSEKKVVGITGFYRIKGESTFWLGYFAVVKQARRRGLGSMMLQQTLARAKSLGCEKFGVWTTSKRASEFYRKNEFNKGKKERTIVADGKVTYRYPKDSVFYYKNI
ncbi:MAG: hypothetical protein QT00_C0001G0420 [archaeon GW2011_AR5]|nr:MAG: hypothetical protein QT00_C0001G0420 [archaeon GW2011_AR5]